MKVQKILIWTIAVVITLAAVVFQRMTGPTHPQKVSFSFAGEMYKVSLPRSLNIDSEGMKIRIDSLPEKVQLNCIFEPFFGDSPAWDTLVATRNNKGQFIIPFGKRHPAEKINYFLVLTGPSEESLILNSTPVTLRFKGSVPAWLLIPHILLMFAAMLFSSLSGIFAFIKKDDFYRYGKWALYCLLLGGLLFGAVIQKLAFGAYWTGWPFGSDLTDNKTLFAVLLWIAALWINRKETKRYLWAVVAAIMLLAVYSIPHSLKGSAYNPQEKVQGE